MYAEKMMHAMSEHAGGAAGLGVGVLPFDAMALYEQPRPRYALKMPRVVPDQKAKFESDELFRRLSRESEVKIRFVLTFNVLLSLKYINKSVYFFCLHVNICDVFM